MKVLAMMTLISIMLYSQDGLAKNVVKKPPKIIGLLPHYTQMVRWYNMFDEKAAPFNPRYKHDCNSCIFLGQYAIADLYACIHNGRISTVIARYSNRDNDYASGLSAVREGGIVVLIEAFHRAVLKGYLPREPYKQCLKMFVWEGTEVEELVKRAEY